MGVGLLRKEKWFCFAALLFRTATLLFSEIVFTYLKIKNHNIRRHTGIWVGNVGHLLVLTGWAVREVRKSKMNFGMS